MIHRDVISLYWSSLSNTFLRKELEVYRVSKIMIAIAKNCQNLPDSEIQVPNPLSPKVKMEIGNAMTEFGLWKLLGLGLRLDN